MYQLDPNVLDVLVRDRRVQLLNSARNPWVGGQRFRRRTDEGVSTNGNSESDRPGFVPGMTATQAVRPGVRRRAPGRAASTTGAGQAEVALGDVVAVDLAGAAVDRHHRRVAGVVLDPAVGGRARLVELQQARAAPPPAGTSATPSGTPRWRRPWSSSPRGRAGRRVAAIHAERWVSSVATSLSMATRAIRSRTIGSSMPPASPRPTRGSGAAAGRRRWCRPSRHARTTARRP